MSQPIIVIGAPVAPVVRSLGRLVVRYGPAVVRSQVTPEKAKDKIGSKKFDLGFQELQEILKQKPVPPALEIPPMWFRDP